MNVFKLSDRLGWGNEIHIETKKAIYAGSGRGYVKGGDIIYVKPNVLEFNEPVTVNGHCSTPYINNGDHLIYTFSDGYDYVMVFKNIRYCQDPRDMFFGDLVLSHCVGGSPVGWIKSLWNRIKRKPKVQVIPGLDGCYGPAVARSSESIVIINY